MPADVTGVRLLSYGILRRVFYFFVLHTLRNRLIGMFRVEIEQPRELAEGRALSHSVTVPLEARSRGGLAPRRDRRYRV